MHPTVTEAAAVTRRESEDNIRRWLVDTKTMKRDVAAIVLLCRFACAQIEIDSDIGDTGAIADCIGNIQDEEWTEAEKWCEKAIEEFKEEGSTDIEGHLKLSLVLNKLGKHKKAKRMLQKVSDMNRGGASQIC